MSFVFFDTETTGLHRSFDQIIQFAAIKTDAGLNEIDRFQIRSRLLPHVVPHPHALRTNGLAIDQLLDRGLPSHYEMVSRIRAKLLEWSPAVFVGYNSIRFDEEMLRQALYQSLYVPYLTALHGNCRADALSLALTTSVLSPDCLDVPRNAGGRSTFKLDRIAAVNGVPHDRAHDAMADVSATVSLCRLVHTNSPEVWSRFVRFSKKAAVADFVDQEDGFLLTEFYANEAYHTAVGTIGNDPRQANVRLCLDLKIEPDDLAALEINELQEFLRQKPSPIRRVRINAAPSLTALYEASDELLNGLSLDRAESRAQRLKQDAVLRNRLISAYTTAREETKPAHVELRLYESLFLRSDEALMSEFHSADWANRFGIVERFDDERLKIIGRRLILYEQPYHLPREIRLDVERSVTDRLVSGDKVGGGWLTLAEAIEHASSLLTEGCGESAEAIMNYRDYLVGRMDRIAEFRRRRFGALVESG